MVALKLFILVKIMGVCVAGGSLVLLFDLVALLFQGLLTSGTKLLRLRSDCVSLARCGEHIFVSCRHMTPTDALGV